MDADGAVRGGGRSGQAAARGDEPARQRVQVRPRRRPRPLRAAASAAELAIAVDDSGPGVTPELRQAIFERFRQGDGGIRRKAPAPASAWRSRRSSSRCTRGGSRCSTPDLGGARFVVTLPMGRIGAERCRAPTPRPRSTPCSTASSRSCASRHQAEGGRTGTRRRSPRAAARAGRRGQPRHEPVHRAVPQPRLRRGVRVRRPRGPREGAPLRADGRSCRTS